MTGTNDNRPDFQQMIKDSNNKDFQYIIDSIEGDLPVKVISHKAHYDAFVTYKILDSIICLAIVLDFLIAAVIYAIKIMK